MALETLVYSRGTKIGNDVVIYGNYNTGRIKKRLYFGGSVTEESCAGEECPAGSFDATVLRTPNNGTVMGGIPAYAPMYTAVEGEVSPASEGVLADLVCLPNPEDDFLICYTQNFDPQFGETFRAISRNYNSVDHQVLQRADNTLSLSDLYVSNFDGLRSLNGRLCTLIAKIYPKGGGACQEIIYFTNVSLTTPLLNKQADGNASIEISASGAFSTCAVFSAAKP